MKEYSWKNTGFSANAQLVGEELEKLESAGELTADEVLEFAKNNPDSETYKCFEWNDSVAGEKYRRYQASHIMTSISVTIKSEPKETQRVYLNIKSSIDNSRKFKNVKEVLKNDKEYQQVLDNAKQAFIRTKEQYELLVNKEDLRRIIFNLYKEM